MMFRLLLGAALLIPVSLLRADDGASVPDTDEIESFDGWSWKDKDKGTNQDAPTPPESEQNKPAAEAVGAVDPVDEAEAVEMEDPAVLEAIADEPPEPVAEEPLRKVRDEQAATIDPARYEKLVKDNLDLRVQRDALGDQLDELKRENARLSVQVREVESKRQEMATVLQELETAGKSTAALEAKMSSIDAERKRLQLERDDLQSRTRDLEVALTEATAKAKAATTAAAESSSLGGVKEDSPLFVEMQQDRNALASEKAELEKRAQALQDELEQLKNTYERDEAERVSAATQTLQDRLAEEEAQRLRDGQSRSEMERRVMKMSAELEGLSSVIKDKDSKIKRQDQMLRAAAEELRRRDWRMDYAGKTMKTLNRATMDVRQVQNREMLDIHYNAGVMYTERGQFDDARASYLRALAIDPTDGDVHYNLAILYEDHYRDSDKAYVHYKKYLQLNPQGEDADLVKSWLTEIELRIR